MSPRRAARRMRRARRRFSLELQRLGIRAAVAADRAVRMYNAGRGPQARSLASAVEYWRARCRVGPWCLAAFAPRGTDRASVVQALLAAGRPREAAWVEFGCVPIVAGPVAGVILQREVPWEAPIPTRPVPLLEGPRPEPAVVGVL